MTDQILHLAIRGIFIIADEIFQVWLFSNQPVGFLLSLPLKQQTDYKAIYCDIHVHKHTHTNTHTHTQYV